MRVFLLNWIKNKFKFFDKKSISITIQAIKLLIDEMKKILSLILVSLSLSIGCLLPAIGFFAMSHADSGSHQESEHNTHHGHMQMSTDWEGESDNMHECCSSPFQDSLNNSKISLLQDDGDSENNDFDTYFSHIYILENTLDRVNSPPIWDWGKAIFLKNSSVSLVGIIKNNN